MEPPWKWDLSVEKPDPLPLETGFLESVLLRAAEGDLLESELLLGKTEGLFTRPRQS
jgi:hypothetical protein